VKRGPTGNELAGLGAVLAGTVVAPMLIGLGIDSLARTGPLFFLSGLGLGVLGSIMVAYTRFKRFL
jgi:predicted ABC-type sugar transport system permease subunit